MAEETIEQTPKTPKGNRTFHCPTEITNEAIADIVYSIASGTKTKRQLCTQYKIGISRLTLIESNNRFKINDLKAELAKVREDIFKEKLAVARAQILENITEKDIKRAGLSAKTRSMLDLTTMKNLEEGKATQNIDIAISGMSKDQLREFIMGGEVNPNIVDATPDDKQD